MSSTADVLELDTMQIQALKVQASSFKYIIT